MSKIARQSGGSLAAKILGDYQTRRQQAEDERRETEARYRKLMREMHQADEAARQEPAWLDMRRAAILTGGECGRSADDDLAGLDAIRHAERLAEEHGDLFQFGQALNAEIATFAATEQELLEKHRQELCELRQRFESHGRFSMAIDQAASAAAAARAGVLAFMEGK